MTGLEPIVQAIEFAEAHLCAPINVADMAGAASYSLYHFCRMFGKLTRHTPYDYLMRRRMFLAAGDVIQTDRRIVDIALDYQFESHEGFTRAFQRMFKTSAADARQQGFVPAAYCLPRLTGDHLACLQRQQGLIPKLMDLPQTNCPALVNGCPGPGEVRYLPAAQIWPLTGVSLPQSGVMPGELYGCFTLTGCGEDLPLVLDWTLRVWRCDYDTFPIEKVFQLKVPILMYRVKSSDVSGNTSEENRSNRRGEEKRYTGSRETAQHGQWTCVHHAEKSAE